MTCAPSFPSALRRLVSGAALALAAASLVLFGGCGGGDKGKKEDPKKTGRKPRSERDKPAVMEKDPREAPKVSEEIKELVKKLGAKDEKHWKPAQEKIEGMGEGATPAFWYAMTWTLQNIRARACTVASKWKKNEAMVPGLLEALQRYEEDTNPYETAIRRWAARCLGDLANSFTLDNMQVRVDKDKDLGVRVLLARGIGRLAEKGQMEILFEGLKAEDTQVAAWAAEAIAEILPKAGLKAEGFGAKTAEERSKAADETLAWWSQNANTVKLAKAQKITDPTPIAAEIRVWKPPADVVVDEREVDLNVQDAEEAKAAGDWRKAAGRYRSAWSEFSGKTRTDIALLWHDAWRRCGPDNADKSYKYLRDNQIPADPLNEDLYFAAAESALASGGELGKKWARECYDLLLILNPDNEDVRSKRRELGEGK